MGKRGPKNRRLPYFKALVMQPSDGCRMWPFSLGGGGTGSRGYGQVRVDGRLVKVSVLACERWHGPRPEGKVAAHRCGNQSCWAGEHLYWATPNENEADKLRHGTRARGGRHGMVKLTEEDVLAIRRRAAEGEAGSALAREYKVTHANICRIVARRTWTHI